MDHNESEWAPHIVVTTSGRSTHDCADPGSGGEGLPSQLLTNMTSSDVLTITHFLPWQPQCAQMHRMSVLKQLSYPWSRCLSHSGALKRLLESRTQIRLGAHSGFTMGFSHGSCWIWGDYFAGAILESAKWIPRLVKFVLVLQKCHGQKTSHLWASDHTS